MMIGLLIRKDESRQAGAIRGCAAGFVAVVMGVLLIFSVFSGEAMACGGDPPPDCPPCSTPDGQGGCIPGCTCPCEGCLPGVGCYEDCPTGENCCCPGGQCYNPNEKSCCGSGLCGLDECERCVDGVCEDRCTYYYADWCMICDGAGYCIDRCNPDLCKWCDGHGNCVMCNGNPDDKCCDGSCYTKCTQSVTGSCSDIADIPCPPCFNFSWKCNDNETIISLDTDLYTCSGGCPGECDWVQVDCEMKYECAAVVDYLALCEFDTTVEETRCIAGAALNCYECYRNPEDDGDTGWTWSMQCK